MPRGKERRTRQRFAIEVPLQVVAAGRELTGRSINLSLGGMLIELDETFPVGTPLTVSFRLPALEVDTEVEVVVRWNQGANHGLQFGSMRARDVWALNKLFNTVTDG